MQKMLILPFQIKSARGIRFSSLFALNCEIEGASQLAEDQTRLDAIISSIQIEQKPPLSPPEPIIHPLGEGLYHK